jgi:hypothetical protein
VVLLVLVVAVAVAVLVGLAEAAQDYLAEVPMEPAALLV